jgi:hypothetical protein
VEIERERDCWGSASAIRSQPQPSSWLFDSLLLLILLFPFVYILYTYIMCARLYTCMYVCMYVNVYLCMHVCLFGSLVLHITAAIGVAAQIKSE